VFLFVIPSSASELHSTVEHHLSGRWLSGSPIIRVGWAFE